MCYKHSLESLALQTAMLEVFLHLYQTECLFCLFQLWRPVTATLYFPLGFPFLVNLYFLYNYSTRLETGETAGLGDLTHVQSHMLSALFVMLIFFLGVVFQECLMANLQTISSCSSSTGSALLYPLSGTAKYQNLYTLPTVNHSFNI